MVLVGGGALIALRATVATVVQIHGDGMAPTIVDGDTVLLVRGKWSLDPGDIVVYDPTPAPVDGDTSPLPEPAPGHDQEDQDHPDARKAPVKQLRNTAVVDKDEFEGNWERVKDRSGVNAMPASVLRLGRVLAQPGDTVTFNVEGAAMGLSVNGSPVQRKDSDPMRIVLRGQPVLGEDREDVEKPRLRGTAYEWVGDVRYPVLTNSSPRANWGAMALPPDRGPVEVTAPGYLILADNREEGACCDSRAVGWVTPEHVRGEVVARLAGDSRVTPDLDPRARGLQWLP